MSTYMLNIRSFHSSFILYKRASVSLHGQLLQTGSVPSAHMTGTLSHDQCFQRKLVFIHSEILRFITVSSRLYYPLYIHNHYSISKGILNAAGRK